ncbi:exodeoxyribonuclease VII small subunit [Legionella israelensis]|uniref:Exodeoxyribonuclease 7 small subunit n=1 Tax=Legionella israelensis TaxID=454 RepID=A0A0W0WNJ9_9GAMM|nr:exodeoxyribonuclease VII small subunit [Legionella israelensis]KTD33908.1 exodeoxyribonuclease VII small subunit [Legionella israelensis]QBR83634.1 exodeoxyribonuclease VII small subunit [Legionella israelensis]QBS08926.1 exodeoxyribonuclease VII small subunit [Legionella israelensis]QDP73190.1 exodeoxyribonuclease VII small subunit [Legionella israelensis]SCX82375.1 Exodeoxyribonuclease VII small subunit [Legionella israelensis DSM 19235]
MSKKINFEKSINELESIVNQLEKGELSLDESLKQFEKGIRLARECQDVLNKAEQKIEILTQKESQCVDDINEYIHD